MYISNLIKCAMALIVATHMQAAMSDPGLFYSDKPFRIQSDLIESLIIDVQPQQVSSIRECLTCQPKVLTFSHDLAERFEWDIYTGLDNHLLLHHSANYWVLVSLIDNEHRSLISIDKVDAQVRAELERVAANLKRGLVTSID